jgi:hypothetical protein
LWKECRDGRPGFEEGEIRRLLVQFGGEEMGPLYDQWVAKPGDLPIEATLAKLGLTLTDKTIVESESAPEESRNLLRGWFEQKQIDRRFASR